MALRRGRRVRPRDVVERRADLGRAARTPRRPATRAAGRRSARRRSARSRPGRSRTQASATSSGRPAEPLGGRGDRLDDPAARGRRGRLPTKFAKCGDAARESAGVPVRYLPVSTPRPSGDQASTPRPSALGGRQHLVLDAAVEQGVLDLGRRQRRPAGHRPLPGRGLRGLPAGVVRDADVRRPAGRDRVVQRRERLLQRRRRRPRCAPARGRRGRRRAGAATRRGCSAGSRARRSSPRLPRRRGRSPALVAITTSSRATTSPSSEPISSSDAPSP